MKNKTLVMQALMIAFVMIAVIWELTGYLTEHRLAEMPKQVLGAAFFCWLVYTLFRTPQDDDWAGQC